MARRKAVRAQSFAQRAKRIIKKYPRAEFDKIEKKQLDSELAALAQEQEQVRQEQAITNTETTQQVNQPVLNSNNGVTPQIFAVGGTLENQFMNSLNDISLSQNNATSGLADEYKRLDTLSSPVVPAATGSIITPITQQPLSNPSTLSNVASDNSIPGQNASLYEGNVSPVGLIASTVGNIPGLFTKADKINYGRVTPQEISLARERKGIESRANIAGATARRNLRISGSPSQYLSNIGAISTGLQRTTDEQLGRSFQNEEVQNAKERARANSANVQIGINETEANAREQGAAQSARLAALQGIIKGAQGYTSDVNKTKQMYNALNVAYPDYSIYSEDIGNGIFGKKTRPVLRKRP